MNLAELKVETAKISKKKMNDRYDDLVRQNKERQYVIEEPDRKTDKK